MQNSDGWIDGLIEAQRPGFSLDRAFYEDDEIFRREFARVISRQWIMAAHVSQIPDKGDYLLFDIAGESIIIVRSDADTVHAHFNVCRHRGSRIVLQACGKARTLTCRYHGWSYALDGKLRAAASMPDDFDVAGYSLKPCHVRILESLIFVCLADGDAPEFEATAEGLAPFLQLHGIGSARLAHREIFPVHANWKLVVENYLECYHCKPAHREYCRVEIKAEKAGDGSPAATARYDARYKVWRERVEQLGTMLPDFDTELPTSDRLRDVQFGTAYRAPLREKFMTGTEDGNPVGPLMGNFNEYDGGETGLGAGPFSFMLAYNDYATFFQFVPRDAEHSDIICTWLVDPEASKSPQFDLDRLLWLWTVTTRQDKDIIEANAAGIRSSRYEPGPASLLESDVVGFRQWCLRLCGPTLPLQSLQPAAAGRYFRFSAAGD